MINRYAYNDHKTTYCCPRHTWDITTKIQTLIKPDLNPQFNSMLEYISIHGNTYM